MQLEDIIKNKINTDGQISFSEFMHLALYYPKLGYYTSSKDKISAEGDFITATSQTSIFATTVAQVFAQSIKELGSHSSIIEFGAGTGKFATDSISELERLDTLPHRYIIVELSNDLKLRQQEYIRENIPDLFSKFEWLNELPKEKLTAIIFANEVLDAMPVDIFNAKNGKLKQQGVIIKNEKFQLSDLVQNEPRFDNEAQKLINDDLEFVDGYTSEINTWIRPWIKSLADCLEKGIILLCDYGYHRAEYYRSERDMGTLACYHQHKVNFDPFINISKQDITAHVDFTSVAESACENGLELQGYMTQANFLKRADVAKNFIEITKRLNSKDLIRYNNDMKELLLGDKLGEVFKVIGLSKGFEPILEVFDNDDNVDYLL
ncbi:SAM-dependent methyltransferase [Francisellaceae bacterium CB300]|jgi:SAM-dependent MidA family methyltransferase